MYRHRENLTTQAVGDELLIFDPETKESHLLKSSASELFNSCELVDPDNLSHCELGTLKMLVDKGLLVPVDANNSWGRRTFLKTAIKAAALPAVLTVMTPKPVMAGSCVVACAAGDCCGCGPCDGMNFCMEAICTNASTSFRTPIGIFVCGTEGVGGAASNCTTATGQAVPDAGGLCSAAGVSGGTHIFFCCTS